MRIAKNLPNNIVAEKPIDTEMVTISLEAVVEKVPLKVTLRLPNLISPIKAQFRMAGME
jgi:hypothetical protein